jgi:hypothetical protein
MYRLLSISLLAIAVLVGYLIREPSVSAQTLALPYKGSLILSGDVVQCPRAGKVWMLGPSHPGDARVICATGRPSQRVIRITGGNPVRPPLDKCVSVAVPRPVSRPTCCHVSPRACRCRSIAA